MYTLPVAFLFAAPLLQILTTAAVAAGVVAVPIVIHLLNRRRYRVVRWAAMRFLLAAQKKNSRRMRLEQILLLMCRVLMVLCIVLAMASVMDWAEAGWAALFPNLGKEMHGRSIRTHRVLVLDGSFSMAAKPDENTCFEKAQRLASELVEGSSSGDAFSVVLMAAPPRRIVAEPSVNTTKVAREIQAVRLPHGNADIAATLNTVEDMLRKSPASNFDRREVYFFTDLQQSTWIDAHPANLSATLQKIRRRARTFFVDVSRDGLTNLAVTNLVVQRFNGADLVADPPFTTTGDTQISATVHNYGTETREGVRAELWVGKARGSRTDRPFEMRLAKSAAPKRIEARGQVQIDFPYRFPAEGDYAVQVRIDDDALEVDNVRSAVVSVKDHVPVLLVNGKPASRALDRATETLRTALDPFKDDATSPTVFRPHVLTEDDFKKENLGRLTPYDCVFFCDVQSLNEAEVQRLESHVYSGGGAVFFLGDNVDPAAYDRLLFREGRGLLPANLGEKRSYRTRSDRPLTFTFRGWEESRPAPPPLTAFTGDDRVSLLSARFRKYFELKPAKDAPPSLLTFLPSLGETSEPAAPVGEPALIDWQPTLPRETKSDPKEPRLAPRARGRVILFASTANTDWNSWPASPSYLAFMQELARYACSGRLHERTLQVGDPLEEYLSAAGSLSFTINTPDGRKVAADSIELQESSVLRFADNDVGGTDLSGIYRAAQGDNVDYLFAVNPPVQADGYNGSESDLTRTTQNELRKTYPEWDLQVVPSPEMGDHGRPDLERMEGGEDTEPPPGTVEHKLGPVIANGLLLAVLVLFFAELVMAWRFARHTAVSGVAGGSVPPRTAVPVAISLACVAVILVMGFVLGHAVLTGNFMGFMPEVLQERLRSALHVPPAPPGETTLLSPRFNPFLTGSPLDLTLAVFIDVIGTALIGVVYFFEGGTVGLGYRVALAGIRFGLLQLILAVLLPQFGLAFERESWPDIVVLIDDSQSMSTIDEFKDEDVKNSVTRLTAGQQITHADRLALARALVAGGENNWIKRLLTEKRFRVHVYHFSSKAQRLGDATEPKDVAPVLREINELEAGPEHDSTQIGAALREILGDFRGSSLAAILVLTDGVTTQGEDLVKVSAHAKQMDVPLFLVGIGDARPVSDLELHDLNVDDAVLVNDRLIFNARLTAHGFKDLQTKVQLRVKGDDKVLAEQAVRIDGSEKPLKISLPYQPTEPGEKTYVISVPVQDGESNVDNNRLERRILVREAKAIKVLYIEGYPRWEYRYIKNLLARESEPIKGHKSLDLKVYLQDADPEFAAEDSNAIADLPARVELFTYDVVLLGDFDPRARRPEGMAEHLRDLADFVKEKGGGLLMIAGPRHAPHDYADTALADVLPIDMLADERPVQGRPIIDPFRPELTPVGKLHPIFRFANDDAENEEIWNKLQPVYWHAEGCRAKPIAEVLAVHPTLTVHDVANPGDRVPLPLVAQQFVGSGRCLFLGLDETWRWRFRESELHFNQFWIQTVRYLARSRIGRIELRLDKQTPYHRGDPVKITVRFPDDAPAPPADTKVEVAIRRTPPRSAAPANDQHEAAGVKEWQEQLALVPGSRASFQAIHTETPEGDYQFELVAPFLPDPRPRAEARVLAPPTEMERLQMNQTDMQLAARETGGKFYTLADADKLIDELPQGTRMTLSAARDAELWNKLGVLLLVMFFFSSEWILRKLGHLL